MMIAPRIAQEIVTRIMRIIPHNINVMDARGIIIASGTPARVGTLHTGAQAALARQQPMEIGDDAAGRASGMRPGINLLLYGRGEVCGVVGITGDPREIRHFAELVRVTAEMIIEQALLTGELQRQLRYREEFVFQLLRRTAESAANLQAWAARLNFDPATPHMVVVLVLQDQAAPHAQLAALQTVQAALLAQRPGLLLAVMAPQELALIESLDVSGTRAQCLARTMARLAELDAIVAPLLPAGHALSAGVGLAGLEEVAVSYWTAQEALAIARARGKTGRPVSYYELSLPVLLADLNQGWKREQLRAPIDLLAAADTKGGALRKTLAAWLAHGRNAAHAAQVLHIHRNTLNYRLHRIHEATGLDLDNIDDLLLLYVGLALSGAGPDGR